MTEITNNLRMRDKKWAALQAAPQNAVEIRRDGDTIVFRKTHPDYELDNGAYGSIDGWGRVTWLEGIN